jgi:hypothetical protein
MFPGHIKVLGGLIVARRPDVAQAWVRGLKVLICKRLSMMHWRYLGICVDSIKALVLKAVRWRRRCKKY